METETYNGIDVSESENDASDEQETTAEENEDELHLAAKAGADDDDDEDGDDDESDESDEQPTQKAKPKPEPKPEKRKLRVKIDGEEADVDEEELVRDYQKFRAAEKRFQEASRMRKEADALIDLLRNDPVKALEHPAIGKNFKELAEEFLIEQLKREQLTPEQRELMDTKQKLAELERQQEMAKQHAEQERIKQLADHYEQEIQKGIIDALQTSGLPKTNVTIKRMAYYMHRALEQGYEVSPKDVVDLVRKDYQREIQDLLGAAGDDVLESLLGPVGQKLRKLDVKRVKSKVAIEDDENVQVGTKKDKKEPKKMSVEEFDEYINSL
jgi:hypothetical protein